MWMLSDIITISFSLHLKRTFICTITAHTTWDIVTGWSWTDLRIFWRSEARPKDEMTRFWWQSRFFCGSCINLQNSQCWEITRFKVIHVHYNYNTKNSLLRSAYQQVMNGFRRNYFWGVERTQRTNWLHFGGDLNLDPGFLNPHQDLDTNFSSYPPHEDFSSSVEAHPEMLSKKRYCFQDKTLTTTIICNM